MNSEHIRPVYSAVVVHVALSVCVMNDDSDCSGIYHLDLLFHNSQRNAAKNNGKNMSSTS